jgi:hypothetical protein
MLPSTSFFKTQKKINKKQPTGYHYIDTGDYFIALAVMFIDNLKEGVRLPDASLEKILNVFFALYPDNKINQALSPVKRMHLLVNSPRKSEIIANMASVLQKLCMDKVFSEHLRDTEPFDSLLGQTLRDYLKHIDNAPLPVSFLAVLAKDLEVSITLSITEPDKELRKRIPYEAGHDFAVVLPIQGASCFARLKRDDVVGQSPLYSPAPFVSPNSETTASMLDLIAKHLHDLWTKFEQTRKRLVGMVDNKELNKELLMAFYINNLPDDRDAQFFTKLEQNHVKKMIDNEVTFLECKLVNDLVHFIASGLTVGRINEDKFFESIERTRGHHTPVVPSY